MSPELVFTDEAVSGATEAGRDGFRRMREAIFRRPSPVSALVVDDLSRLGRNMIETLSFQEDCDYYGIEIVTVDGLRSSNPASTSGSSWRSLIDDVYIQDLRHKTLRGLEGADPPWAAVPVAEPSATNHPVPSRRAALDPAGITVTMEKRT